MKPPQPLIFKRPAWWYLFSGICLLLAGVGLLFCAMAPDQPEKPGAKPTCYVLGILMVPGAVASFGFSCQTIIDFAGKRVTYEWSTFFLRRHYVYPLSDVDHVGVRSKSTVYDTFTHHVFLAILNKAGLCDWIELKEIVKHAKAVKRGQEVAEILGKPLIDYSEG